MSSGDAFNSFSRGMLPPHIKLIFRLFKLTSSSGVERNAIIVTIHLDTERRALIYSGCKWSRTADKRSTHSVPSSLSHRSMPGWIDPKGFQFKYAANPDEPLEPCLVFSLWAGLKCSAPTSRPAADKSSSQGAERGESIFSFHAQRGALCCLFCLLWLGGRPPALFSRPSWW